MTDRREFLGAIAAVFCGVVLPEPERAIIDLRHATFPGWTPYRTAPVSYTHSDLLLLRFFQEKPPTPSELPKNPIHFDLALR